MVTNKLEYLLLTLMDLALNDTDDYVVSRDVAERQGGFRRSICRS